MRRNRTVVLRVVERAIQKGQERKVAAAGRTGGDDPLWVDAELRGACRTNRIALFASSN